MKFVFNWQLYFHIGSVCRYNAKKKLNVMFCEREMRTKFTTCHALLRNFNSYHYRDVINIPEEICFSATRWNIQTTEEKQWYQTALNCKLKPTFMEGKFSSTVQVTFFESFCWVGPYAQTKFRKENVTFNTTIFYCLFRCYSKWEVRGFLAHVYGWQYPFL